MFATNRSQKSLFNNSFFLHELIEILNVYLLLFILFTLKPEGFPSLVCLNFYFYFQHFQHLLTSQTLFSQSSIIYI